jgi:hypothetical protein
MQYEQRIERGEITSNVPNASIKMHLQQSPLRKPDPVWRENSNGFCKIGIRGVRPRRLRKSFG